jgi:hypothetical protein
MTKKELMDLVLSEYELRNCDTAIPQSTFDKLREMDIEPFGRFIMIYFQNGSRLFDLFERFYQMYSKSHKLLEAAEAVLRDAEDKEDAYYDDKEGNVFIPEYKALHHWITEIRKDIEIQKS